MEKQKRSILKTLSWRVVASTLTILIVFVFTGKLVVSLGIGLVEVVLKMTAYYFHERFWDRVDWGRGQEKKQINNVK